MEINMKKMKKMLVTLTGIAMIGGAFNGLPLSASAAAETALSSTALTVQAGTHSSEVNQAKEQSIYASLLLTNWMEQMAWKTELVSGLDSGIVMDALNSGQTFVTASGLAAGDLTDKLAKSFEEDLQSEVRYGYLTEAEFAQLKSDALGIISKAIYTDMKAYKNKSGGAHILETWMISIVQKSSLIAEKVNIEVKQALRNGSNLVESTGLDSNVLVDGLTAQLTSDLETFKYLGKISDSEYAELLAGGTKEIARIVAVEGYDGEPLTYWRSEYASNLLDKFKTSLIQDTMLIADKDYDDVINALAGGATLSTASGLDGQALTDQLAKRNNEAIEREWAAGRLNVEQAEQLKEDTLELVRSSVFISGFGTKAEGTTVVASNSAVAKDIMQGIVDQSAAYSDKTLEEYIAAIEQGQSLVQATGLDQSVLVQALQSNVNTKLQQAVARGQLSLSELDATRAEAYQLLNHAVITSNYVEEIDADRYVQQQLDQVVEAAASLGDISVNDVYIAIADGKSLAEATGMTTNSFLVKLIRNVNQELNEYAAAGSLTQEQADAAKAGYATKLSELNAN
jgi:hypothetical protein